MDSQLKRILSNDSDYIEIEFPSNIDDKESSLSNENNEQLCNECNDMRIEINCLNCDENFCSGCFQLIHNGGKRKDHQFDRLIKDDGIISDSKDLEQDQEQEQDQDQDQDQEQDQDQDQDLDHQDPIDSQLLKSIQSKIEFIPLRLTFEERFYLNLLDSALNVSEYTDKVDIISYKSKSKRIISQIKQICSILIGLIYSSIFKKGEILIKDKNFKENSQIFKSIFEIGRRYKILNPNKFKNNFGKLCYIIMDSKLPEIEEQLEFNLYTPIKTIKRFIQSKAKDQEDKIWGIFKDKDLLIATSQIQSINRSRILIKKDIKSKEFAIKRLISKYSSEIFPNEDIEQIIYSIDDYNSYIFHNRNPTNRFINRLKSFELPEIKQNYNIGIQYGRFGSKLTHDHNRQYNYVLQSLTLWSIIQREMIYLWSIADDDLFNEISYRLSSTGQGLNRIKQCPNLYKTMYKLIGEAKSKCSNGWIGSSVIHLGDDAVPNALFFLDKYIQIPNILIPIDQILLKIPELFQGNDINLIDMMVKNYQNEDNLKLLILQDCFSHMFDGSGADNFFMSGSCIDGRLTSAWNFTNEIHKREYYKIFLLTGFIGFNGED
ncbi:hypothetical protein WICMUC_002421 [Wickerhamomyces mucosus]|uniref:B box-type domain-containing protein n=1 Tax=Wickerhamomyces mucosus TaxID=1378264 RepID=A0A9P8PRR6_9ASCO|nr:hypothetical protein WICMUC_002421 [Wickerhamomyces mucosus]